MLTKRDHQYFAVATALAKTSNHFKAKLGAIIVHKNEIISTAVNAAKSHPIQKLYNIHRNIQITHNHIHAEIHSIIKTTNKQKLKGATIYVSRVKNDQAMGMARPCPACFRAIQDYGIKNIFYTTNNGYAQETII